MKRREFIAGLVGVAAWPREVHGQRSERPRLIGALMGVPEDDPEGLSHVTALRQGLRAWGWEEGNNLQIDYRWSPGDPATIRAQAAELVALRPDLIVALGSAGVQAVQPETRTIPIVFVNAPDPVNLGFVVSLAHPGGNITGFTGFEPSMAGKWLEILKEVAPGVTRVGVLFNPDLPPYAPRQRVIEALAPSVGVEVTPASARDGAEIEQAIASFATGATDGLIVQPGVFATAHRKWIVQLAARHRLPAVYPFRHFAAEGGLITYGLDIADLYRKSAAYVDRILRGTHPTNLPVQAPTKFALVINLKTAKTLGLEIPPTLLARADEVIE